MKGTKLFSIFTGKCPVCHTGKMYKTKNAYRISETLDMYENCQHCDTKFKIEPSFFYGAMYVSYAVGIVFAVAAFVVSYLIIGLGRLATFLFIATTLIVSLPIIVRLSRNIWINFFLHFDKNKM